MHAQQADIDQAFAEIIHHFTEPQHTAAVAQPTAPTKATELDLLDQIDQINSTHPLLVQSFFHQLRKAGSGEQTSRHLDHARQLIQQHGWTQGTWGSPELGYCIRGALSAVMRSDSGANQNTRSACVDSIELVLRAMSGGYQEVAGWNDAPGRTAGEVVAVLRQAAEVARRFGP